ncbi:hypothetical protein HH310_40395 [Actinoplanes sp. TBRC 11911]|uniref:hypothetical protein n=1 Tax=Actinoplanes sp. TBRC 11911 TaxID=2729386 RepID=UPI00145D13C2|nr:hypothetical protein [Actinoplanes sp. TBRC 11911]NMO57418.1 hypothetical protein [Actinoplanes sp. TBRC 11911]
MSREIRELQDPREPQKPQKPRAAGSTRPRAWWSAIGTSSRAHALPWSRPGIS